ncbi:follistatin-related protein 5 [Trichonephila clavipes]|nr:follistatin-related protein 5 [Trichonephila clavipes]
MPGWKWLRLRESKLLERIPRREVCSNVVGNGGCSRNTCGRWRECETNTVGEAICTCHKYCKKRKKPVCGTDGRYYANHCELHREACLTDTTIAIDHKRLCLKKRLPPRGAPHILRNTVVTSCFCTMALGGI